MRIENERKSKREEVEEKEMGEMKEEDKEERAIRSDSDMGHSRVEWDERVRHGMISGTMLSQIRQSNSIRSTPLHYE